MLTEITITLNEQDIRQAVREFICRKNIMYDHEFLMGDMRIAGKTGSYIVVEIEDPAKSEDKIAKKHMEVHNSAVDYLNTAKSNYVPVEDEDDDNVPF